MTEIELHDRYPHSRHEDISDAFTRGAIYGIEYMSEENERLRKALRTLAYCVHPDKDCDKCAMNGADMHVTIPDWLFCDSLVELLEDTGIEVVVE